jgi:hypothetical protein
VAQGLGTTLNLAVEQKDHRLSDEVKPAVSIATSDLLITAEKKGSRVRAGGNVHSSKLLKKRSAWPRPLDECVLNSDDRVELRVRVRCSPRPRLMDWVVIYLYLQCYFCILHYVSRVCLLHSLLIVF